MSSSFAMAAHPAYFETVDWTTSRPASGVCHGCV